MGKANAKRKDWREKLTKLNVLNRKKRGTKDQEKIDKIQREIDYIKSKI